MADGAAENWTPDQVRGDESEGFRRAAWAKALARWRAAALDDLETIISYIAGRDGPAAERLHVAIETCAGSLREYLYRPGRLEGHERPWCTPITSPSTR
jgi:hypothetical protein